MVLWVGVAFLFAPLQAARATSPVGLWEGVLVDGAQVESAVAFFCPDGRFGVDDDPCRANTVINPGKKKWGTWKRTGELSGTKIGARRWRLVRDQLILTFDGKPGRRAFTAVLTRGKPSRCPRVGCP